MKVEFSTRQTVVGTKCDYNANPYKVYTSDDGVDWLEVASNLRGDHTFTEPLSTKFARYRWESTLGSNGFHFQFLASPSPPSPPVFEVDFGNASHQSMYTLHKGAYIGSVDNIKALRVGGGKYANLPININPSSMTDCTIEIWFKLRTIPQHNGWLVSTDDIHGWYDRGVIVHDERFGGGVAPIPGATYNSGLPAPTLNEWSHVVVVYRQDGVSTAFLNGARGDLYSPTTNNEGFTTLTLGTIVANNIEHATDAWVKSITIWNEALSDVQVQGLYTASPCATNGQREGGHRCCLPWEWVWELDPGGGGDGKGKRPSASRPNGNASHRKAAEITAGAAARRGTRRHGQGEGERCGVDCC